MARAPVWDAAEDGVPRKDGKEVGGESGAEVAGGDDAVGGDALAGDEDKKEIGLMDFMREPTGRTLPDHLQRALDRMRRNTVSVDERVGSRLFRDGYEMAIAWHAVLRMMQLRAAREANEQKRILLYVQAVDVSAKQRLDAAQYRRALQVVNMTHTGKLLGMCPLVKPTSA